MYFYAQTGSLLLEAYSASLLRHRQAKKDIKYIISRRAFLFLGSGYLVGRLKCTTEKSGPYYWYDMHDRPALFPFPQTVITVFDRPVRVLQKGGRELKRVLRFIFAIHGLMVILINGEVILRGLAVPAPLMGACLDHYWMVLLRKWRMFKKAREKDYKPCISFARSMLWQSVFRSLAILSCCRISVPLSLRRLLFRKDSRHC